MTNLEKPLTGDDLTRARNLLGAFLSPGDTVYLVREHDKRADRYWFTVLLPGTKFDGRPVIHNISLIVGQLIGYWNDKRQQLTHNTDFELVQALADVMAPEGVSRLDYYKTKLL